MSDRELLELAAKAAGIVAQWDCPERGMMVLSSNGWDTDSWNPLTDDGDAFRLAVSLNLSFCVGDAYIVIHSAGRPNLVTQQYDGDPYAATRRAIVRAAAEIGKAMGSE